jgi:chemotaxis protein histidine kinase CheA
MLRRQLEEQKNKGEQQTLLMSEIVNIPLGLTKGFIVFSRQSFDRVNNILECLEDGCLRDKVREIFNETHRVKARASSIGFHLFAKMLNQYEENVEMLKNKIGKVNEDDFLVLADGLDELYQVCDSVSLLLNKIESVSLQTSVNGQYIPSKWMVLKEYIENQSKEYNIDVETYFKGFRKSLPEECSNVFYDCALQFIRNSFSHGFEANEERESLNKVREGQITMQITSDNEGYYFSYFDDGKGVDLEMLQKRVSLKNIKPEEDVVRSTDKSLSSLLFSGKCSGQTGRGGSLESGMGVGLFSVFSLVKEMGGTIEVKNKKGEYLYFGIYMPKLKDISVA